LNSKINLLLSDLNEQLNFIDLEIDNPIKKCEKAIEVSIKAFDSLKKLMMKLGFKSNDEEIIFFKEIKPQFLSKFIYYNAIYKIETRKPYGGERIVKKYYQNELIKLKRFFDNNLEFYKYYRTGSTYLDLNYFIRGKIDIKMVLDSYYIETDRTFSTSHDYIVSRIIANDLIELYLEDKLLNMHSKDQKEKSQVNHKLKQTWTGSKVALIELLYALHTEGVFNNGASDLKEIAEYFESVFDIDLGQYHRAFLEIRVRKSEPTKFLNTLKEKLIKRMENSDELI
jgi:hypothetical protein